MQMNNSDGYILLTGGSGLVGHYLLAELLAQGRRCAVVLREPMDASRSRLSQLVAALGIDLAESVRNERIVCVRGDLAAGMLDWPALPVREVIHAAAVTRFQADARGEPMRTNVGGTALVLDAAAQHGVRRFHLISSAYTCGRVDTPVFESYRERPAHFHNAYEESKWRSEELAVRWADRDGRLLHIIRPSIVVGAYDSGRCTRFGGFYLSARATEFLDRAHHGQSITARRGIILRICGRGSDQQNIVPVDYVAAMIAGIVSCGQGGVYHVTHPKPPTNELIKLAMEQYFGIGGGVFVEPEDFPPIQALNELERQFYDISGPVQHYFVDTPTFLRDRMDRIDRQCGIHCPEYSLTAITRLLRYAQSSGWGRATRPHDASAPGCAEYFEHFLPRHIGRSDVARMTALTTTVRFIIDDEPQGQWVCRFDAGRLAEVHRGANHIKEDVGYRATREVFWDAVAGRADPQELFLTGRAELFGDIEQAMKLAMIMHAFNREFPCDPDRLRTEAGIT